MRVEKTANGKTTRFVYGLGGQLLYEKDLSPNRDTYHVYLHGQPIAMIRSNTVYTVLTDHLGRAEVLVNSAGTTVWRANLRAFDRQVITDQIGGYQLGFPGQYHDEETGYAYNIHRDYDAGTGRYLQSDPIGLNGGLNTYGYVGGNPVMWVDPWGLEPCICRSTQTKDRVMGGIYAPRSMKFDEAAAENMTATRNTRDNARVFVAAAVPGVLSMFPSPVSPYLGGLSLAIAVTGVSSSVSNYVAIGEHHSTIFYDHGDHMQMITVMRRNGNVIGKEVNEVCTEY